jgi:hypothetical protein
MVMLTANFFQFQSRKILLTNNQGKDDKSEENYSEEMVSCVSPDRVENVVELQVYSPIVAVL